jgi:hypothetical protein
MTRRLSPVRTSKRSFAPSSPRVRDGDVNSVELAGRATAVDDGRPSVTTLVKRLGAMVNRYHKAFTVRL